MQTPYGWNVNVYYQSDPEDFWMAEQALHILQPQKWMNYSWIPQTSYPGFVPTVWTGPLSKWDISSIQNRMCQYPDGETYLFINEGHASGQADISPTQAVDTLFQLINAAHDVRMPVNTCGPNAAIAIPAEEGVGRLSGAAWHRQFLKEARAANVIMSSNGVHMYYSPDRSAIMRIWSTIKNDWRRNWIGLLPIVITEVCANDHDLNAQIEVMDAVFELYQIGRNQGPQGLDGIMGAWWFAAFDDPKKPYWPNCGLTEIDPDRERTMRLTPLGKHWLTLKGKL